MKFNLLLVFVFLFIGCSKKNISTVEVVDSNFIMPELKSAVNILFKIDKDAINDTFNIIVDKYLDTDMDMDMNGFEVHVSKQKEATMEFLGKEVLTTLPIKIDIEKETFIKNITGEGQLELNFITSVDLDSSWRFVSKTRLEHHQWIEKPQINLAGLKINVESLADMIIDRSKPTFEKQIDLSVADQVSFKDKILDLLKYVEKPILMDTVLNSWLHIKPENIYLSHIENSSGFSVGNLTVHGQTKITSTKPIDVVPGIKLPRFNWEESLDDTSHINMVLDISYDKMNEYLTENYNNKTFESGGKKITLNNLYIRRSGEKLEVLSDVKGSMNGKLKISGKPVFNNEKQYFYTDDIDIDIATKNVFHKAGAWLFKSKIKNQLKDMLRYSVRDNIKEYQILIDKQISDYSVEDELEFKADLRNVQVNSFALDNDRIHAFITLNILLETKVYNLSSLENPTLFKLKD